MGALASTDVTVISSVPLNQGPGKTVHLVDLWIEPSAGVATADTINASALGVQNVRSLLNQMFLDGGAWVPDDATNYADLAAELRARVAYDASGSSASVPAVSGDDDVITFTLAATRDAAWLQLLVES